MTILQKWDGIAGAGSITAWPALKAGAAPLTEQGNWNHIYSVTRIQGWRTSKGAAPGPSPLISQLPRTEMSGGGAQGWGGKRWSTELRKRNREQVMQIIKLVLPYLPRRRR